jgi:hypothetical protein
MMLLWVIPIDLRPRLADLLDNEVFRRGFDDPLDGRFFMSRDDDEAVPLPHYRGVLMGRDLNCLDARGTTALAVEGHLRRNIMLLGAFLDARVDAAEDLLVSRRSVGKVHSPILA